MFIFLLDWFRYQLSVMDVLGLLALLALVAVAVLVGKVLCGLVDFVFDLVEGGQ